MKRFLFTAALLTAATSAITAHTLDGIVKDHKTGEPLIGTVIRVKELPSVSTTTGLDGTFTLRARLRTPYSEAWTSATTIRS